MRAKKAGAKLVEKSALERELQAWIDAPTIKLEPISGSFPQIEAPEPFEGYSLEAWQAVCRKYRGYIKTTSKPGLPSIKT